MSLDLQLHVVLHPDLISEESVTELLGRLADFSPALETIGGILEGEFAENFEMRGHGQWAQLKQSTKDDKFRRGYDAEPLVRSGALFRALTQRDAPGHKFLVSPTSLIVGVYGDVIPYADWLATGTRRMPARILINVTPSGIDRIIQAVKDFLGAGDAIDVWADAPIEEISFFGL